jgi:predicted glycogen debranching enzyme
MISPHLTQTGGSTTVVDCRGEQIDSLLAREWLTTNRIGAFASGTLAGCNTRRYHGLLVAATSPPVGRIMMLSTVMERLETGGESYDLATNEFDTVFSPTGYQHLTEFRNEAAITFVYRIGECELTKDILLADAENAVTLRYTLRGASGRLVLSPFAAIRDFHELRLASRANQLTFLTSESGAIVKDSENPTYTLDLGAHGGRFVPAPDWWYSFHYRNEAARGQDAQEDLYSPGRFEYELQDQGQCFFTAALNDPVSFDFDAALRRRTERRADLAASVGPAADETSRALAISGDAFIVNRDFPNAATSATILAGYHWFADWGRDAFVSLPGLLLTTRQFSRARKVFNTFAQHLSDGMIPNCFDDYGASPHYNSIDASLWFIIAVERYIQATGDKAFWKDSLLAVCDTILHTYREGAAFDIRADADGLLTGGSIQTQLTWMDAALDGQTVTPRYGKAVEINALWCSAHRIMANRCGGSDERLGRHYAQLADVIEPAFEQLFWNPKRQCLFDCVNEDGPDAAIRPNQIFAVSLPHSPLAIDKQRAVLATVKKHLLTPRGLRTLSPEDPNYCPHYQGSPHQRDRAYHQGTVWAWLIGPFIEAHLKASPNRSAAIEQAEAWLDEFDEHLAGAAIGHVSEIFDGDPPHQARGCVAQAWSTAELLRAKMLVREHREALGK